MSSLRKLYYSFSPQLRFLSRRMFYLPVDLYETVTGKRDELTPPRGMIYTGSGDFKKQGKDLLKHFIELTNLKPQDRVLDVGSGIGRIAVPLTTYLNQEGSYEGFDLIPLGVNWCKKNISSRFPNFNFQQITLENDLYNSSGESASDFVFPYADNQFNLIVLTSVFTHMLPDQVENYIKEISRVLQKGGYCFATFFILNEENAPLKKQDKTFQFPFDYGHYALMDDQVKSANVAYQESYLENIVSQNQLTIDQRHYGYWSGRDKASSKDFQDVLILKK